MKRLFFFIVLGVLIINLLPMVILNLIRQDQIELDLSSTKTVRVWFPEERKVKVLPLEEYIVGVVAAEMPASFSIEALKAQAIAARTYTIHKIQIGRDLVGNPHPDADVCTSPLCCQAWISSAEQNKGWGLINAIYYREKIKRAVAQTKGIVITYDGKLVDPVYHSTCGGHTEDASDVWQYDAPYLKGVPCKYDKDSPKYLTAVKVSLAKMDSIFGTNLHKLSFYRFNFLLSPVKVLARTSGGRVQKIKIGEKEFSGVEVRTKLNLNSAKFDINVSKNGAVLTVSGYGHGVGMCQYGAGGMAKEGKSYQDILNYYYKDIKLVKAY